MSPVATKQIPVQLTNHFWTVTGVGKGTVKRVTKKCNLFCIIAAIWVESRFFAFYLPRIKPVLQQIRLLQIVKPFCKEKIRKVKRSPIFSSKICTCWAFYRPKANYSFAASDECCLWHDSGVILTNQKSVFAQLATTGNRYKVYWGNWNEGLVPEAISYDFLTVVDDRRVRNSGIHVVVDYEA